MLMALRVALLLSGLALVSTGCGAGADAAPDSTDDALVKKASPIPVGTYVRHSGPSGSFDGDMFDSQEHVVRLTVKPGNKFDADVLVEVKQTSENASVKTETVLRHGTLDFSTVGGKRAVYVGEAGTFSYTLDGDRLSLATVLGTPRRTVLDRDDSWSPGPTSAIKLRCVSRNPRKGDPTIDVTLDGEQNQSGTAVVKDNGNQFWPRSGRYAMDLDQADAGEWRHFKGRSATTHQVLELSFPKADLARKTGSFDGGGGYSEASAGLDSYALGLTCTHGD